MGEKRTKATVMLELDIPFEITADKIAQNVKDCLVEWSTLVSAAAKVTVEIDK